MEEVPLMSLWEGSDGIKVYMYCTIMYIYSCTYIADAATPCAFRNQDRDSYKLFHTGVHKLFFFPIPSAFHCLLA